ncbi:MAG: DUF5711 family protein [Clostridiales bacterium]|jgi:hypothetical protein|nr:DUF5711 family protein [Clostridiales bacterium]
MGNKTGRNKKRKNKNRAGIVLLIVIAALGGMAYANRGALKRGAAIDAGKTVFRFETGQQYQFAVSKNNLLALNGEGVTCVSQSGAAVWNAQRQASNPCMQSEGGYTLLFDRGNRDVAAYDGGTLLWELQTEQPIITAKINQKGYSAVVTYDVGYKSRIEVYDARGGLVYQWRLGDRYVVDAEVSPDCNYFAAAVISPDGASLTSKIIVVDIDAEQAIGETARADSLVMQIKYQADGSIVALCENELVGVSAKGERQWAADFGGRELQHFKLSYDTNCVLVFAGSRNNSILEVYSRDGKKTGEYVSDSEITDIDVRRNVIAAAEHRSVVLLNLKGAARARLETRKEVKKSMLTANGNLALAGGGTVDVIKP